MKSAPRTVPPPIAHRWKLAARRWPLNAISLLFTLLLLTSIGLGVLLGTEHGLRWALTSTQHLAPTVLRIGQIDGRALDRVRLTAVTVNLPKLSVRLGVLELVWNPSALARGVLAVEQITAHDVDVVLAPSDNSEPLHLPPLLLPLAILVGDVQLERLRLFTHGSEQPRFVLESASLSASQLVGGTLELGQLQARLAAPVALSASLSGRATLTDDYPLALDLAWTLHHSPTAHLSGSGSVRGDLQRLDLTQNLSGAATGQLATEVLDVLGNLGWAGRLELTQLDLPAWRADLPPIQVQARLQTQGTLADAKLSGTLDLQLPESLAASASTLTLALHWQPARVTIETFDWREQRSLATARLRGALDLSQPPLGFTLDAAWSGLRWPLAGAVLAESATGTLSASGTLDAFVYQLAAQLAGPQIPRAQLALSGQGTARDTRLDSFTVELLDGRLAGAGTVTWAPALAWDLHLNATQLNPGVQFPDWPGRLDAQLTSAGQLGADGPQLTAEIAALSGQLRNNPISASGRVQLSGERWQITHFHAASGANRLTLDGHVDQTLDLAFQLDAPDLATLWPQARGRLKASGQLQGPRSAPHFTFDLNGAGLALAAYELQDVRGTADLDLASDARFVLNLSGRDLRINGQRWTAFDLRGTGRRSDHQVTATLKGEPLTLTLAASGALAADGGYRGRLSSLNLAAKSWGKWSLQRPLALERVGERLAVGPFCVQQSRRKSSTSGCVSFVQTAPGRWSTELNIDRLDLALLREHLPPTVHAEGVGRITGQFTANGAVLTGNAVAAIPRGRLRLDLGQGQTQVLDLSQTRLTLDANAAGLAARLVLPFDGLGRVQGELRLAGWRLDAPTRPAQPLGGALRASIPDLRPLASLVPDLSALRGQAQADLQFSGTLGQPGVSGRVAVEAVQFHIPLLALHVESLQLHALAPTSDRFELSGAAALGGGTLTLNGYGRAGATPMLQMRVAGQRLTLANTKDYFVRLSPQIEIEATPSGATVRGAVQVPEARIRPRSLPAGTVSPSPDVVLKPAPPRSAYPLTLDLRLILGDEVTLDSFGVRGRLAGALSVRQEPGRELLGDGQLQITEGEYRLSSGLGIAAELGAPLSITQGRLIYAKSPLNNPGLLLQAERNGGDLTAGVRVVGTLRHPKLTFFSESDPGLTQADITKYLMTGIPPSGNDRTDNAGLAIGTYLAPKIYMEYESGLSDESNKVKLRYELSKHIELQTETGENQGADIFFKFEH